MLLVLAAAATAIINRSLRALRKGFAEVITLRLQKPIWRSAAPSSNKTRALSCRKITRGLAGGGNITKEGFLLDTRSPPQNNCEHPSEARKSGRRSDLYDFTLLKLNPCMEIFPM